MMYVDASANQEDQQYQRFWKSIQAQAKITSQKEIMMKGWESLMQTFQDEWQAYQDEHFAAGDGAPRLETAETGIKARFREILWQYPKLTRPQAYLIAVMEIIGYRGYLVPPELAPGVLAQLESNDGNAT